jgi:hypothetical protein
VAKRVVIVVAAIAMLGAAYAAGAATQSGLAFFSGRELRSVNAVTNSDSQTVVLHDLPAPPTPVDGARLVVDVRSGRSLLDIRFSSVVSDASTFFNGEILVDGVPLTPTGWGIFATDGGTPARLTPTMVERFAGPLSKGKHVITVVMESRFSAPGVVREVTLGGWTLVAEEVRSG